MQNLGNATVLFSIGITLSQQTNGGKYSVEKTEQ